MLHQIEEIKGSARIRHNRLRRLNRNLKNTQERDADPAWRIHCERVYLNQLEIVHRNGRNGSLLEKVNAD